MYEINREAMYYEKDPIKMSEEEAKLSVAHWRAKYETIRNNFVNLQTDLDRVIDLMEEEKRNREMVKFNPQQK